MNSIGTECYLYQIRRVCDAGDLTKGYVGISNNPARRLTEHTRKGDNPHLHSALTKYADTEMVLVSEGTRIEMLTMEAWLRPERNIGWNIAEGGVCAPSQLGFRHSNESKVKMSASRLGVKKSKAHCTNIGKSREGTKGSGWKGWWEIEGTRYESANIAFKELGLSNKQMVIRRTKSKNFPNYKFIPKGNI